MPRSLQRGLFTARIQRRRADGSSSDEDDQLAVEEPLEIRIAGDTVAVTMRTPGHDHELVAGFCLAEGLIGAAADLGSIVHCGHVGDEGYGNVIDVSPAAGFRFPDDERFRRGTLTSAACGICGRVAIDDLLQRCRPLSVRSPLSCSMLAALPERFSSAQPHFRRTGGLHAAALINPEGDFEVVREDVGRHNAVDKVFGRLLLDAALPRETAVLLVSGRVSFEIVQKCAAAGVGAVMGLSAPSSLAVQTAERVKIVLIGFARNGGFNVYTEHGRLRP
jgi:FdhD protein